MIVVLNGYPGVGKFTIGAILANHLSARFLDLHTVYNLAFALTEFRTPLFRDTVRRLEGIADELIDALPPETPLVTTTILTHGGAVAEEEWARLKRRAETRPPLCMVHLTCAPEENRRRIADPSRAAARKPRDPAMADRNQAGGAILMGEDAPHLLRLDVTGHTPEDAALEIASWLRTATGHPPADRL